MDTAWDTATCMSEGKTHNQPTAVVGSRTIIETVKNCRKPGLHARRSPWYSLQNNSAREVLNRMRHLPATANHGMIQPWVWPNRAWSWTTKGLNHQGSNIIRDYLKHGGQLTDPISNRMSCGVGNREDAVLSAQVSMPRGSTSISTIIDNPKKGSKRTTRQL